MLYFILNSPFWLSTKHKLVRSKQDFLMKIISTNVYVGPNVFALFPVIRHVIDIGILEEYPSVALGDNFIDGLINAIPTLEEHGCSYGVLEVFYDDYVKTKALGLDISGNTSF